MLVVLPDELEILRDMQPLDRDVFNYLAARVDFETGVIGVSQAVSHPGMALDLSERDQARRAKGKLLKLTTSQIENAVKRLVASGLLERMSGSKVCDRLVVRRFFWVQALAAGKSVQNPDAAKMLLQMLKLVSVFGLNNNELEAKKESRCQAKNGSDATTSNNLLLLGGDDKFAMFLEWQPSDDELSMIYHRAGVDGKKVKKEWVSEFVSYWWADQKRCCTQREWTAKFGKQMVGFLRNPSRGDELCGVGAARPRLAGPEHYPDYARIPKDDGQLVAWMRQHGYGDPLPGHDYRQARAYLQRAVDKRLNEERGRLS